MVQTNKKVLIVEDEKGFLWILKQSLIDEGFDVVVAQDGQEGLAVAEKEKPDLILLDIMMPKMDGIMMAKKLKESQNNVPIIFLTNMKDEEHISEAMEAVPDTEYIIKSDMNTDGIVDRVKSRLNIK
jgi:DNA-binding response OmpR family regulator